MLSKCEFCERLIYGTTGGARLGAGRPAYRLKAEQTPSIDIRIWHKRGPLGRLEQHLVSGHAARKARAASGFTVNADTIRLDLRGVPARIADRLQPRHLAAAGAPGTWLRPAAVAAPWC
jgi:hypothetical protein